MNKLKISQTLFITNYDYIQVVAWGLMNGMVRNLERLAFETCFLNNLGFLMDIKSCEREFHGSMTREEKKCLDKLFLHKGISSFFEWPHKDGHYITLHHFIHQLHLQWPMVHQQIHSSSPNTSLKRWVFKSFLKVSVFVSSWRLDGREFHAFGPENEKLCSPNFSYNRGGSYRKLLKDLSLSRPGRSATDVIMSDRYAGLRPTRTRCMNTQSL